MLLPNHVPDSAQWALAIKKNKNTFAKMMRERKKKQKADEKRQRRLERKNAPEETGMIEDPSNDASDSEDSENAESGTESVEDQIQ